MHRKSSGTQRAKTDIKHRKKKKKSGKIEKCNKYYVKWTAQMPNMYMEIKFEIKSGFLGNAQLFNYKFLIWHFWVKQCRFNGHKKYFF
jgi:hypothetical protein